MFTKYFCEMLSTYNPYVICAMLMMADDEAGFANRFTCEDLYDKMDEILPFLAKCPLAWKEEDKVWRNSKTNKETRLQSIRQLMTKKHKDYLTAKGVYADLKEKEHGKGQRKMYLDEYKAAHLEEYNQSETRNEYFVKIRGPDGRMFVELVANLCDIAVETYAKAKIMECDQIILEQTTKRDKYLNIIAMNSATP